MKSKQPTTKDNAASPHPDPASVVKADPNNQSHASVGNTKSTQADKRKSVRKSWRSSGPIAKATVVFTGVLAVTTILYTFFAGWQLVEISSNGEDTKKAAQAAQESANAASQQVQLMDKTLTYSERAFVYGKDAFVVGGGAKPDVPDLTRPAYVMITFANAGNTQARDMSIDVSSCIRSGELPDDFSYPSYAKEGQKKTVTLIGPRSESQTLISVPDDALHEVHAGRRNLFVWGSVAYKDIFGANHASQFCFRYTSYTLKKDGSGVIEKTTFGPTV